MKISSVDTYKLNDRIGRVTFNFSTDPGKEDPDPLRHVPTEMLAAFLEVVRKFDMGAI